MADGLRTIAEAKALVKEFCEERNWDQFHNPKDLAIGIETESSELLQHFRFKTPDDSKELLLNPESRQEICDELADVFYFVLRFAQMNDIDLYDALVNKIAKNNVNYPLSLSRNSNKKYTEF